MTIDEFFAITYARHRHAYLQRRAHYLVHVATQNGDLVRAEQCERCNKPCRTVAHHDDYMRPLDVSWFCHPCHMNLHRTFHLSPRGKRLTVPIEVQDLLAELVVFEVAA